MARWLPFAVYLVLAGGSAAAALVLADEGSGAEARVLSTEGDFELTDSRVGIPIFSASGIGPGDSASGTVEIGATGSVTADLVLSRQDLLDTPGLGGGELSRALALRVTDVTAGARLVYSGLLATMPAQQLGRLEPGASRTFEFVATLPEGGPASDQDDVQGAALSVAYVWTASEAVEPPRPSGGPGPSSERLPALAAAATGAHLAVAKIWRRPRHGLVLARAVCDRPCAIAVRGKLRAWGVAGERSASIPLSRPRRFVAGPQRLVARIPPSLRVWLHANPRGVWARASLVFVAHVAGGERAVVRRAPWLRHPRWTAPLAAAH